MNRFTRCLALALLLPAAPMWSAGCAPHRRADGGATAVAHARVTAEGLFARGQQLARRGDSLRGEQYMVMAVRRGYPERRAITAIVATCLASGRLRSALAHAEPFLRRHPHAWQLRQVVGALHMSLGRPARAHRELTTVVAQQPGASEAHYLLASLATDNFDDEAAAAQAYASYLEQAPDGLHAAEARAWLRKRATRRRTGDARP